MAIDSFDLTTFDGTETVFFDVMNVESPNQQWGNDDSRITVQYKVPWAQRYTARTLLLGESKYKPAGGGNPSYISRTVPHAWIEEDAKYLYCIKVTGTKGHGTRDAGVNYTYAILSCTYQDLPYYVYADDHPAVFGTSAPYTLVPDESSMIRWVEIGDTDVEGRIILAYGLGACYCDAATEAIDSTRPVLNGAPVPYYEETLSFIWHQVPVEAVPWTTLSGMVNKINSASFAGYPAKTLMFVGRKMKATRLPNQDRAYNIDLKFKYNPNRWDRLPDPVKSMQYFRVRMKADPTKGLFELGDFNSLLRPA